MKNAGVFLTVVLTAVLCISSNLLAYSGGDGLSEATAYQISDPNDWQELMATPADWDDHFILTTNLDMTGVTISSIGNTTTKFTGTFDGDSHIISYLSDSLFGYTWGATIKNVTLTNVMISPNDYDNGPLIGMSMRTTITNCHSSGSIMVDTFPTGGEYHSDMTFGGLVGSLSSGTMSNCSSTCSIVVSCYTHDYYGDILSINIGGLIGATYEAVVTGCFASGVVSAHAITNVYDAMILAGGFVGSAGGTFTNCYSRSSVSAAGGSHSYYPDDTVYITAGGFAGSGGGIYTNCYSTGAVSASGPRVTVGGFSASPGSYNVTATSAFWDTQTSGQTESSEGKGLTTAQMKTMSVFQNAGWGEQGWVIQDGVDYPRLSWEGSGGTPIPAASSIPLSGSGTQADPYLVTSAQEFASLSWYSGILNKHLKLTANLDMTGVTLYPIGDLGLFTGVFDGDGHTISNVTIHHSKRHWTGLFASLGSSGQLLNLGVINADIQGNDYVGGLVGIKNASSIVTSCYTTGSVSGNRYVGGLVGYNYSGSIHFSYSACTVQGTTAVGGLVGDNAYGPVSFCYATGSVSGNTKVGGLTGANGNTITNCYATGSARGNSYYNYTGGLVGYNTSKIISSYSTGPVSSGDPSAYYVGGLAGYYAESSSEVVSSFWDRDTSGQSGSAGGTGKTTAEMKLLSTFVAGGWDFVGESANGTNEIWTLVSEQYPQQSWQYPIQGDIALPYGVEINDLQKLAAHWLQANCPVGCEDADLSGNGTINLEDAAIIAAHWLQTTVLGTLITIPDLTNLTQSNAVAALINAGLTEGVITSSYDQTIPTGNIISQTPAIGTAAYAGTAVNLVVSLGQSAIVPDVMYMAQADAEAAIIAAGLTVGTITSSYSDYPAGDVISQNPEAESVVPISSTVDIEVSMGPWMPTVPDVVGMIQGEAEATISGEGFNFVIEYTYDCNGIETNHVVSQNPVGGTVAQEGTTVTLVICQEIPMASKVTGMTQI